MIDIEILIKKQHLVYVLEIVNLLKILISKEIIIDNLNQICKVAQEVDTLFISV